MQIDRLGEQHGNQQIAVQCLDYQVHSKTTPELGAKPELEQRHANHRNRHHKSADIRDQHREPDQHRQQQRIVETKQQEAEPGCYADHHHFQHLPADIVGDLLIHLFPYLPRQPAVTRQHPAHGVQHLSFIFDQKEHHQWDENQVNRQRQQTDQ